MYTGFLLEALYFGTIHLLSMIKRLLLAAAAAAATMLPVSAEIQPGTKNLVNTINDNGVLVTVNDPECTDEFNGQYRFRGFQRWMLLCPGETVDADDHNTVRHETIHAIQHCVNTARGTSVFTPIINDDKAFSDFVLYYLSEDMIEWIVDAYPSEQWDIELEAFAGAKAYTASELTEMFLDACVANWRL